MAKPVWVTDAGNLGTIEEEVYYELGLEASDSDGGELTYQVISGYMPAGIILKNNGSIAGRPKNTYKLDGVPFSVSEDVTSTFCIRATDSQGKIADRTFSLTVTGQDSPEIITPASELARVFDGTWVEVQIEFDDDDGDLLEWKIIKGALPPGLSLNSSGLISGYVDTEDNSANGDSVGWSPDAAGWSEYPWSHAEQWLNQNYEFTIQLYDGKEHAQKTYNIFVLAKKSLTSDLDNITVDSNLLATADMDQKHNPVLLTQPKDFGYYEHDNYFAFQFTGKDFDNDEIYYGITGEDAFGFDSAFGPGFGADSFDQGSLSLPEGITLNAETGWLYGYIGTQLPAQQEYTFGVYTYKADNDLAKSDTKFFTLTIVSDLSNAIVWQTPTDLGKLLAGSISELAIETTNPIGMAVLYELESGSLPQGLKLLNNGLLVGRASFEFTSFDSDSTTFDFDVREAGSSIRETTLDREFTFRVKVSSSNDELLAYRNFTVTIDSSDYRPYDTLYLRADPGMTDKNLFKQLADNTDIFPPESVYRVGDPNFGRSKDVRVLLLGGLVSSRMSTYIAAMQKNHYRKKLRIGEPKLSKAYDENRNVIYEVLYYDLNDNNETATGSVNQSIDLTSKIEDGGTVYPNSLVNMRNQLINEIGFRTREELPLWMSSRQEDGNIIGWKSVVVLSYLKPGTGEKALFNLKRLSTVDIKLVDLDFDRYIIDNNMSKNYNSETGEWDVSSETTFDLKGDFISPPVATVDAALEVPFSIVDGRTDLEIDEIGGLDGLITVYEGKTVIFATQEQYVGYNEPFEGWLANSTYWDDSQGWGADWDGYEVIPGYNEKALDNTVVNKRAGVWKFVRDGDNDILRLEFQQEIQQGETVLVRNGFKYGGYIVQYNESVQLDQGKTVPDYLRAEELLIQNQTTFNINGDTRFISSITKYEDPDESDKYLVFPKETIWA